MLKNFTRKSKYLLSLLVAFVVLLAGFGQVSQVHAAASKTKYIQVLSNDVNLMDNSKGKGQPLVKVGVLKKDQVFPASSYGVNWWKVQYGNGYGYVYSKSVKEVKKATYKNGNSKLKNSKKTITPANNVAVNDNTGTKLVEFATLEKNVKYPIVSDVGNWYKVLVGDRIGYVYKPAVEAKAKPEPAKEKYIEVTAKDVAVMDNTQGATLVKAGSLVKGQQFAIIGLSGNWYKVEYGSITGFVYKTGVKEIEKISYKNVNKSSKNSSTTIVSTKALNVIDNSDGGKVTFATIEKNVKYPVISDVGNWYKVSVGKRIGYVYKPAIKADQPQPETPKPEEPKPEGPKPEEPKPSNKGVAVLRYENILDSNENKEFKNDSNTISLQAFKQQMMFLDGAGYKTVTPEQLAKYVKGEITLPEKSVVITFDGGYQSVAQNAIPELDKFGFKATFFVSGSDLNATNTVFNPDKKLVMDVDSMRTLVSQGHVLGAFPKTLTDKGSLENASLEEAQLDLELSRDDLSNVADVRAFAYPFGGYNPEVTPKAVEAAQFTTGFALEQGLVKVGDSPYTLKRISVTQSLNINDFMRIVQIGK